MYSKNYLSTLAALVAATVILATSCKKNDDISSASGTGENQMGAVISSPTGMQPNQLPVTGNANSFTITSHDGHTIGVNGTQPAANPKTGQYVVTGCGSVGDVAVQAVSFTGGCGLYNGWTSGGGAWIALYVNGQPFKDPTTGYGLWTSGVNGLTIGVEGGLTPGQVFHNFVRTYCSADTTGSTYYDSRTTDYIVPETFICSSDATPGPRANGKKRR